MRPVSLDASAWVTLAPSPAGRGGAGRAVGGESRQSVPIPDQSVSRPGSHPHVSGLTHEMDSKARVFTTTTS